MAWGKKLLLSLSVFAIMLRKRLPDGSKIKRRLLGWFESLMILAGRCPAERGEQTLRSARLSAELCSPDWRRFHTTLRCTEMSQYTFYGLWIESFQNNWRDPEFPQLLQMVHSLPCFLNLCLNVWSPMALFHCMVRHGTVRFGTVHFWGVSTVSAVPLPKRDV